MSRLKQYARAIYDKDERYRLRVLERKVPVQVQRLCLTKFGGHFDPRPNTTFDVGAIFIHIPKTGGTSVSKALNMHGAGHIPFSRYYAADPEAVSKAFSFAIVRNPWDRLVSSYHYLANPARNMEFRDFRWAERYLDDYTNFRQFVLALKDTNVRNDILDYIHFIPQLDWIAVPGRSDIRPSYIGRFETLDASFEKITSCLGTETTLPVTRQSRHRPYQEYYDTEMKEIVADIYSDDIDAFGYSF